MPKPPTSLILCLVFLASHFSKAPARADSIPLLDEGKSSYVLTLNTSASASEKHAAEEIQTHFEACTGVKLPIVEIEPATTNPLEEGPPRIILGRGKTAEQLGVRPTDQELGEQGFVIRTVGPHIVIAGTAQAGTLHGARYFLKQILGVRWYAPGVTKTPKQTTLSIEPIDRLVKPGFSWRDTSYAWPGGDEEFRSRRGENSGSGDKDRPLGEQYSFDGKCHSYFSYISPDEFFESHPEYFSLINGQRTRQETQLCLTNPDVLDIVTERMLQRMKERPHERQHNFSQMDWYNYCQCDRCRAINEKYGTAGGTQYWFLNELAKRTSKVYPDKLLGTLAYMYTEEPPKGMEMHPNVAVWLCHMFPCCDSHPIVSCPLNADYRRRAETWSKICSHLYVWHYIVDFAHYYNPFPNFRAMSADMKFYHDLGVEGIYAQAMGHSGGGGEFSLLRAYYVSELLQNPNQDPQVVLRDFLEGYYGAAAEPIWQYITLLHHKVDKENIHMHLYTNPAQGYLTDEVLAESEALFDEAEAAVKDDPELLERVRVARMPLVYAKLFPRNGYKIEDGTLQFQEPLGTLADAQAFVDRMKQHGFQNVREQCSDPNQILMIATFTHMPLPVVTLGNEHLQVDVVPFLGGRVLRIIDRKTGKCVTAHNTTKNLLFPFCGGEESRAGGIFTIEEGGSMDPAFVKESTEHSVTMVSKVRLGFMVERTITLDPNRPIVSIRLTMTNPTDEPKETTLRSHLSLDLGDVAQTRVAFTDRAGQKTEKDMTDIIAGLREGERYYRESCPDDSWSFTGPKGLNVTQRFDNSAVDFTCLCAYPSDLNELEVELWSKKVTLAPGESITLKHSLEVR